MKIRARQGFTLVEIFVAVAIATVIGYFVISFSLSLARIWRANQNLVGTEIEANIVLDTLSADLQTSVMLERGTDVMFAVSALDKAERGDEDSRGWVDPADDGVWRVGTNDFDPASHVYGWAGSWVRFYTAAPTLNAVAYQVVRREPFGSSERLRYGMFRSVVRQDYTETAGFDITATAYGAGAAVDSNPKTITKPNLVDLIAENVVDFGLRLYVYDKNSVATDHAPRGLRLIYPADGLGQLSAADRTHLAFTFDQSSYGSTYPDVAEIYIRVLDSAGAALLEQAEEEGSDATFEEIVAEHGQLFHRMVELGGARNKR